MRKAEKTLARRIAESGLWLCDNDVDMHCRYCSAQHPIHEADCLYLAALAEVAAENAVVWIGDDDYHLKAMLADETMIALSTAMPGYVSYLISRGAAWMANGQLHDCDRPTAKTIAISIARLLSEARVSDE